MSEKSVAQKLGVNESPIRRPQPRHGRECPQRVGGSPIPAIRTSAFTFSSLSEAV